MLSDQRARVAYDIFTCARCDGCLLGDHLDGVVTDDKVIQKALDALSSEDIVGYCTSGHALTTHMHRLAWRAIPKIGEHVPSNPQGAFYISGESHATCSECQEAGELRVVANSVCYECLASMVRILDGLVLYRSRTLVINKFKTNLCGRLSLQTLSSFLNPLIELG